MPLRLEKYRVTARFTLPKMGLLGFDPEMGSSVNETPKGTCLHDSSSFEPSSVKIHRRVLEGNAKVRAKFRTPPLPTLTNLDTFGIYHYVHRWNQFSGCFSAQAWKKRVSVWYFYRQHCAKRKAPVFNLLRGRFGGFSPRWGPTLHRWGWNLPNFTPIGATVKV